MCRGRRLRPGLLRHPRELSLPLLPSGPDGVRRPELRRSQPSTPSTRVLAESPDLGREFDPATADCRYREPPAPHLARPHKVYPRGAGTPRIAGRLAQNRFTNVASAATGSSTSATTSRTSVLQPRPRNSASPPSSTPISVVDTWPRGVWCSCGRR